MRMRDIEVGKDYAVSLPNIARAPNSGGSTIVRCRVGEIRSTTRSYMIPEMAKFPPCMVRPRDVLAPWEDYVAERGRKAAAAERARSEVVEEWSHAFDGIDQGGVDLGDAIRSEKGMLGSGFALSHATMEAIADRINLLDAEARATQSEGWGGEAVDTGLPTITVRELPPHCPQGDLECPYA